MQGRGVFQSATGLHKNSWERRSAFALLLAATYTLCDILAQFQLALVRNMSPGHIHLRVPPPLRPHSVARAMIINGCSWARGGQECLRH